MRLSVHLGLSPAYVLELFSMSEFGMQIWDAVCEPQRSDCYGTLRTGFHMTMGQGFDPLCFSYTDGVGRVGGGVCIYETKGLGTFSIQGRRTSGTNLSQ